MTNKFRKAVEKRNMEIENHNLENIEVEDSAMVSTDEEEVLTKDEFKINLSKIISKTQKKSKNKTFYLDENVIISIEKEAKKQKVSDSKLLNDILKHIFNIKN
jgi:hypothetical protein